MSYCWAPSSALQQASSGQVGCSMEPPYGARAWFCRQSSRARPWKGTGGGVTNEIKRGRTSRVSGVGASLRSAWHPYVSSGSGGRGSMPNRCTRRRAPVGQELKVRDVKGRATRGKVVSISDDELVVACLQNPFGLFRPRAKQAFAKEFVESIAHVDSGWNRGLIGAAAGAGLLAALIQIECSPSCDDKFGHRGRTSRHVSQAATSAGHEGRRRRTRVASQRPDVTAYPGPARWRRRTPLGRRPSSTPT